METLSVEEYKKIRLRELHDLENKATSWNELRFVLSGSWFKRVRAVIKSWDNQRKIDDGAYNLFRILLDDLDPAVLNSRLVEIEAVSRDQNRLRAYRKSRGELASVQTNQILGSIFEVNIVYAALQSCSSVEVNLSRLFSASIGFLKNYIYIADLESIIFFIYNLAIPFRGSRSRARFKVFTAFS